MNWPLVPSSSYTFSSLAGEDRIVLHLKITFCCCRLHLILRSTPLLPAGSSAQSTNPVACRHCAVQQLWWWLFKISPAL